LDTGALEIDALASLRADLRRLKATLASAVSERAGA